MQTTPTYEPALTPAPAKAPRGWLHTLLLAVSILLIGAGIAGVNVTNSESGADSPQAAVERLVRAITDEDPLELFAALDPREGDLFEDTYDPAADQASNEGLLDEGDPLASLDLRADNMRYRVTPLGQRVASVEILDGDLSASYDPEKLPQKLRESRGDYPPEFFESHSGSTTIAELRAEEDAPLPVLMTVKRDGHWYVSIFYTIAEAIRHETDAPQPDFDNPPASKGAATPKGVIEELMVAVGAVDVDRGLQLLDPESLSVLVDYRSALLSAFPEEDLAAMRGDFRLVLDGLDVTTQELDAAHTRVDITALRGRGSLDGLNVFSFAVDRTCFTADGTFDGVKEHEEGCLQDAGGNFGLTSFFVVVAQRDGQYYLDPLRTLAEYTKVISTSDDFEQLMCESTSDC